MLVVMRHGAPEDSVRRVVDVIREMGYQARPMPGKQRTAIGLIGNDGKVDSGRLEALPDVLQIIHVSQPYKQVSREWRAEPTVIELANGTVVGGNDVVLMAGPCSVESEEQILAIAHRLRAAGVTILRGGAFKPRTSPYAFQGLGVEGLELLARARSETGMAIVTEALETETVDVVAEYTDIIQIGARNMQNYPLLRRAGRTGKPILLKRGLAATINELLLSAEYILAEGNERVILCERGVRGFDEHTRNLLDLTAIPVVQSLSHLPIIADPSHGTGVRAKVTPMARAAVAAGADGLLIEVHPNPDRALSDGAQSLWPDQFDALVQQVGIIAEAIGRRLALRPDRHPALPVER
jgi:3-deoxy-7-phosphoheptulonate synthase